MSLGKKRAIAALLDDYLIRMMMAADHVEPQDLLSKLLTVADGIGAETTHPAATCCLRGR